MIITMLGTWFFVTRWIDYLYSIDLSDEDDLFGFNEERRRSDLYFVGTVLIVFTMMLIDLSIWSIIS